MKIDLNHYGLIGFQREWREKQKFTGNLLEAFVDDCIASGVDACAVTSEEERIPRFSVHDRFGVLKKIAMRSSSGLSFHRDMFDFSYQIEEIGKNLIVMEKDGKRIYLFNAQAARVTESGQTIKILLIGDNTFPDQAPFSQNISYLERPDLVVIPKKLSQHEPPKDPEKAKQVLIRYRDLYDAIVGFNAQASKRENEKAKRMVQELVKPYVAISNKHSFSGCRTCVEISNERLDYSTEENLLRGMKGSIRTNKFTNQGEYERYSGLLWKLHLKIGTFGNKHHNYQP
jgi:hypothetical protein